MTTRMTASRLVVDVSRFPGFSGAQEVLPAQLRLADGPRPRFGDDEWDLSAMGLSPSQKQNVAVFKFETIPETWRYFARTMLMVLLNPADEQLVEAHVYLNPTVPKVKTLKSVFIAFRRFAQWSNEQNKPIDLEQWKPTDLDEYYNWLRQEFAPSQLFSAEQLFTSMERIGQALPSSFLFDVPSNTRRPHNKILTKPIEPKPFWALLSACWSYIEIFSSDILDARRALRAQRAAYERLPVVEGRHALTPLLKKHFESRDAFVPLHASNSSPGAEGSISWEGISLLVPFRKEGSASIVSPHLKLRHKIVMDAIDRGVPLKYGTIEMAPKKITDLEGNLVPWCNGFDRSSVRFEVTKLRVACFIFISALSMMRLSEVAGLQCGALTTHYGAPAIKAKVFKKQLASGKTDYWWVSEPVAKAVKVAEAIAENEGLLFRSPKYPDKTMDHPDEVHRFVDWINLIGPSRGLDKIDDSAISTHRLRRTMSIITAAQPDGEIALGITLKHNATRALANSVTSGYGSPTPAWEAELRLEQQRVKAAELVSQWSKRQEGQLQLGGPGALAYEQIMSTSNSDAKPIPFKGTARTLRNLLRDPASQITFGTLNHCLGDPSKAKCLEGLSQEAQQGGPILADCSPSVCRNSVVTSDHLPLWQEEEEELTRLLRDKRMSDVHRKRLEHRLAEVQRVTSSPEFRQ